MPVVWAAQERSRSQGIPGELGDARFQDRGRPAATGYVWVTLAGISVSKPVIKEPEKSANIWTWGRPLINEEDGAVPLSEPQAALLL